MVTVVNRITHSRMLIRVLEAALADRVELEILLKSQILSGSIEVDSQIMDSVLVVVKDVDALGVAKDQVEATVAPHRVSWKAKIDLDRLASPSLILNPANANFRFVVAVVAIATNCTTNFRPHLKSSRK